MPQGLCLSIFRFSPFLLQICSILGFFGVFRGFATNFTEREALLQIKLKNRVLQIKGSVKIALSVMQGVGVLAHT
tara:strand:- start:465 stop:689 length:225 start_codon:yes stop_codon:yes gene_type:complete